MSRTSFENYGKMACELNDYAVISGRYGIQRKAEKNILKDIIRKLDLCSEDVVLEIGCGPGNLLIPLSFLVEEITGVDHPSCVDRLEKRYKDHQNIRIVGGNFFDIVLDSKYSKILCYSVLHYLSSKEEVFEFIYKAIALLSPGGKALFGEIPNQSKKDRFLRSEEGKRFETEWRELMKKEAATSIHDIGIEIDERLVEFDDDLVVDILRKTRSKGYHAYVYPQSPELPFGYTREDILIINPL